MRTKYIKICDACVGIAGVSYTRCHGVASAQKWWLIGIFGVKCQSTYSSSGITHATQPTIFRLASRIETWEMSGEKIAKADRRKREERNRINYYYLAKHVDVECTRVYAWLRVKLMKGRQSFSQRFNKDWLLSIKMGKNTISVSFWLCVVCPYFIPADLYSLHIFFFNFCNSNWFFLVHCLLRSPSSITHYCVAFFPSRNLPVHINFASFDIIRCERENGRRKEESAVRNLISNASGSEMATIFGGVQP